uniref:Uncharacterized protein n=1 Tax=Triticum urartu TaxID=4572 RepID=A0A8R7TMY0_TRIUA
ESAVEEAADGPVLRGGLVAARLQQVEPVPLPRRLPHLRLGRPPAGPEPVVVGAAAVAEHVGLGHAHEDAPARQGLEPRRAVRERVDERVVLPRCGRARDAPQPPEPLPHRRVQAVGAHLVAPRKVGVHQDEAADAGARPHGHVVRDVGPGAVAAKVEAGEVGVAGEPRIRLGAGARGDLGKDPGERVPRVRVRGGDGVLGREAVLDGDDDGVGARGEGVEVGVVVGVEGGEEAEPAAVVVDEDGQPGVGRVQAWEVETRGDVGGDGGVAGGDPGGGVGGGSDELGAHQVALHAAPVDAEAGHGLVEKLVVASRGRRGLGGRGGHGWCSRSLG